MQQIGNFDNKLFFTQRNTLAWALCALMINTNCNQSSLSIDTGSESKDARGDIANYEVSPAGVSLIKSFEGLKKEPYICSGGTLTVGYGQVIASQSTFNKQYPNGFSEKDAEDLLRNRLDTVYAQDIKRLVYVPLSQREFDMLVSLNYNIGAKALQSPGSKPQNSWTQINMLAPLNRQEYERASLAFSKFTKGGPEKTYYRGLLKRRMTEMFVFRNSTSLPQELHALIEDDNFRSITHCDSIAKYWEDSNQQRLRDEAISLYKAYNKKLEASDTTKLNSAYGGQEA